MTTRRHLLLAVAATAAACRPAAAHNDAGLVLPPLPAPALPLTLHNGRSATLAQLLAGQVTALQLMFTGCSATCPIQGALFGAVQQRLAGRSGVQLLSVSIDPLGDDARAMRAWLQRWALQPAAAAAPAAAWRAALPRVADVERLFDYLRARSTQPGAAADRHTAQVYFFNPRAELVLRSTDFPSTQQVLDTLAAVPTRR